MLPFSNVFYISSNTQSVIDSMKFLYGKYAICCTDEINEFKATPHEDEAVEKFTKK